MRLYLRGRTYWCTYHDARTGRTERVSTRCTERGAAKIAATRFERAGADPDRAVTEDATLANAIADVIGEYEARQHEGRNAKATVDFYRKRAGQLARMIVEGHLPPRLSDLRARHVDAMIDVRRAEKTSRATIAKDLIVLRLALKLAKRRGQWRGDVDEVLPHRFGGASKARERWLTHPEAWALFGGLRPDRAAWAAFAIATSANLSEAAKAKRSDVVYEDGVLTKVHLRGTKREKRDRWVPIVRSWQRLLLEAALSAAGPDRLWAPWTKITRDLHLGAGRAEIPVLSSNDLRRTFATWMRADGLPLHVIAAAMGHTDSRMVERVYGRLDVTQLSALMRGTDAVPNLYETSGTERDAQDSQDIEKT